ncbi:type II secretion system F family protein [Candidatus Soleaferrea massiliensis]|uniref:type II secretion system F family protein n=1 Tax=Candidatus Soleaferrea massiliensis TaxID=1470354 RepID=UPI00058C0D36|nr:type II secretion system F family protein [Candidatus Soleaferrea massiliensis]
MLLNFILLVLATIATALFLIGMVRGRKYAYLVENLDSSEYIMKNLYVVGYGLNDFKLFKLRGKLGKDLRMQARLIWDNVYDEYYALLAWVQFLTLSLLFAAIGLIFAGMLETGAAVFVLCIVLLAVLAVWNLSISKMKEKLQKRREACVLEFPNMVSKLSLLINSGMVLREAWYVVAKGKEGELYDLMQKACACMENGESDISAIHQFGVLSDSPEIKKFTSAMIQGMEKGNSELADFLIAQATELWSHKRQLALQKGEIAAGKLIIPLGLMFGGIIMIVVAAAMQSMTF